MTASEKYAKVLTLRKKKTYKAEDECGFGRNTIANAIKEDRPIMCRQSVEPKKKKSHLIY